MVPVRHIVALGNTQFNQTGDSRSFPPNGKIQWAFPCRRKKMENISKMEMAGDLFKQIYIKTEKKFFGFMTKVTYAPTNSPVVGISLEYSPAEGQKIKTILDTPPNKIDEVLPQNGRLQTSPNGNYRLELCYSKDHEFAALHLQQFVGFEYRTVCQIRFAAGNDAKNLLNAFIK